MPNTCRLLVSGMVFLFSWWLSCPLWGGEPAVDQDGFQILFNGRDLTGWQGAVDSYEVIQGELVCKPGQGGVLFSSDEYTDFEVHLEFLLPPGGNNGLAIRYPGSGQASVDAMCELQILDDTAEIYRDLDPRQYHGAVYGMVAPERGHLKPVGEWNHQKVVVRGSKIEVTLNGTKIIDADVSKVTEFKDNREHPGKDRLSGYFGLAGHNDPVRFRNIRIKRLDPIRIGSFSADVTIPLNHRCMGILPQKSKSISDPLYVHGFVLLGQEEPIVFVAFDWCEIRNDAYDLWRSRLAEVVGTTPQRVLVTSLHQHDAPVIDSGAARLLEEVGLKNELYDESFHEEVLARVCQAAKDCLADVRPVTHVGIAETMVEKIASNRRIIDATGRVAFDRGSSSGRDDFHRTAGDGLIDPFLRTLSFWNGDRCLVELHAYATHPMSYYGRGEVSSDFVGLARDRRQRDDRSVHQIYASGCSGDVTAGKYNDGTVDSRWQLVERLYVAMVTARENTQRIPLAKIPFRCATLELEYSQLPHHSEAHLREILGSTDRTIEQRILAAMGLSSRLRVEQGRGIDLPCVDFGNSQLVLFPGESFVGYQLLARSFSPNRTVVPIGYGESWTGYVPTEAAFAEGFGDSWIWVAPGCEEKIRNALKQVIVP